MAPRRPLTGREAAVCLVLLLLCMWPRHAGANRGEDASPLAVGPGRGRTLRATSPAREQGPRSATPPVALFQEPEPSYARLTNELRSSIVRIQKIETVVNWFEPYMEQPSASAVGTGFAAELVTAEGRMPAYPNTDPVFITNAHVVSNAQAIKIQFAAGGQETFDGYVPVIYEEHDLAVVKLLDPAPFLQYLKLMNLTLRPLPIRKHQEVMGQTVAAIGFPLGSPTLKLGTGVIAGTESLGGRTVLQCTAPISPGNSGGPLLALGDLVGRAAEELQVVGVNFAASTGQNAELVNYVIPAVHIQQILQEFQLRSSRAPAEPLTHHTALRVAPIGALTVHANAALYTYGGCKEGVFVSQVAQRSALHTAKPRVEEGSFIVEVDGVGLDSFGMGRVPDRFLGDPVPFESLMQIKEGVEVPIELVTCRGGRTTRHTVSMVWHPSYELGIRTVSEPRFEPSALDFEVFADVTVMQMTENHVSALMQLGVPPSYGRWLLEENTYAPRLLISKVKDGTYGSTVLAAGMVLSSVNGHNVSTLAEFREHFVPKGGLWKLSTERGTTYVVSFADAFAQQLAEYKQGRQYLLTPAVAKAASGLGLIQSSDQQEATIKLASLFSSMLRSSYEQGQASAESRLRQEAARSSAGGGDGNATRHEGLPPNVSNLAHGGGPAGARLHTAHSNLDGVSSLLDRSARAPRTPGQRPGGNTGALPVRHDEMPAARRHARAPLFGEPSSRL